jgi:glycogen debranching enzyme
LWDDTTAMFLDRDVRDGKRIAVKSAATFLPLAAGIATPQQATALVEQHLRNSAEFATPFPVPSYARSEPAYAQRYEPTDGAPPVLGIQSGHANWCGGMWPHWTIQISHGLQDYGFEQDARLLADQLFQALAAPEGFYEWYDAETGAGCGLNPFWAGATVLGAMLPAELASRFNPLEPRPVDQMLDFSTVRQVLGISPDFTPREIHD